MSDPENFDQWWAETVRRADKIINKHYVGEATDDVRRLVAHAYVTGQIDESKDATARIRARNEQMEAELRRLKGQES